MDEGIKVPAGFHFFPFEEELISLYLKPKILGQKLPSNMVEDRQLYGPDANPWQLFDPENHSWLLSEITPGKFEKITYVFVNLIKKGIAKETTKKGKRENYNKKAGCGTWDGQTKRTEIRDCNGDLIGERRMLSFEINEVPDEDLSKVGYWRMHEYHLSGINKDISNPGNTVLCKITLDHSKIPPVKLRPIKISNKPETKNTNVNVVSSPSTANSCAVEGNQGVSGNSQGAITSHTRRGDSIVSDSYRVKDKECVNSSYVEGDTGVIATSPSKQVKTGLLNPSISDFHWPAKKDKDCKKIKLEGGGGGGGDLQFDMMKLKFSEEEQAVEDTSTSLGKRKLRPQTSYTMTKKLCP